MAAANSGALSVSVIIPTYNRSELLAEALASIAAQTCKPREIIVVDDASTEDVSRTISEFANLPISLIRRAERGGAAAARNTGIHEAKGDYIAFLDSDDVWTADKLEKQAAYHARHRDTLLSCTGYRLCRNDGSKAEISYAQERLGLADLAFGCSLSPGTTLFVRRSVFDEVGLFDEALPRLEDWDWLIRAVSVSAIGLLPDILASIHQTGFAPYEGVSVAIERVGRQHRAQFMRHGVNAGLRFRAALANEMAVANYRRHHFLTALYWLCRSLIIYPVRRPQYYWRVLSGVAKSLIGRSR